MSFRNDVSGQVLKENKNDSNIPGPGRASKKGLQVQSKQAQSAFETHSASENQSRLHKIENDIEEYLNSQSQNSSKPHARKAVKRKPKTVHSRVKTDMETSQDQALVPRFEKKKTSAESQDRLSIFKRFGASKRQVSKKKKKRKKSVRVATDPSVYDQEPELNPHVIRGNSVVLAYIFL